MFLVVKMTLQVKKTAKYVPHGQHDLQVRKTTNKYYVPRGQHDLQVRKTMNKYYVPRGQHDLQVQN